MRPNLRPNPVLQRSHDLPARRVVLRVGAEDQRHIQRQPHRIPLNLHIAFLHDVEQRHLDLPRQIRKLIDREDPAVRPRQQPIVHRQLVRKVLTPARRLDRIKIANQIGHRHIRGRQLLHIALIATQIGNRRRVALLRNQLAAPLAQRQIRIVPNLASRHIRQPLIQNRRQPAQNAALRLPAQPQQNKVLPRQHRIHNLRHDGVVIPDDARKDRPLGLEPADQVLAQLVFHAAIFEPRLGKLLAGAESTKVRWQGSRGRTRAGCGHRRLLLAPRRVVAQTKPL